MGYREILPCAALRPYVDCFWVDEQRALAHPYRVLPDGAMDVLFDLQEERCEGHVVGVMSTALLAAGRGSFVGARFRAGEAFAFLEIPSHALLDQRVDLGAVWGATAREVAAQIQEAPRPELRVAILERALLERLLRVAPADRRIRAAVRAIQEAGGVGEIGGLAGQIGLSERQLERLFRERVGLGPKGLARVERLRRLLRRMEGPWPGWAGLAAALGYADQAHLSREVKLLCGVTPGRLLRERAGDPVSNLYNPGVEPVPSLVGR